MKQFQILFVFSVFLFSKIESESSNLLNYYEQSVKSLTANRLKGMHLSTSRYISEDLFSNDFYIFTFLDTKYCESILLPTENTLKKALDSTFIKTKSGTHSDESDRIDLCCRSLLKCNAFKRNDLNQSVEWNIYQCECVDLFKICLKNLNTTLSNDVRFIYSINARKCFANDYPIVECAEYEKISTTKIQFFTSLNESEIYYKRCLKYEFDKSQPKQLQIFDIPFEDHTAYTTTGMFSTTKSCHCTQEISLVYMQTHTHTYTILLNL